MLSILVKSNRNEVATETRKGSCAFLEGSFYSIQMITNGAHCLHILWPDQNPSAFPWSVFSPLLSSSHLLPALTYPSYRVYPTPAMLLPCCPDLAINTSSVTHSCWTSFSLPQPCVLLLLERFFLCLLPW